jgi:hypothetical protein
VHRDIKQANTLLENGVECVKITDSGLARIADDGEVWVLHGDRRKCSGIAAMQSVAACLEIEQGRRFSELTAPFQQ